MFHPSLFYYSSHPFCNNSKFWAIANTSRITFSLAHRRLDWDRRGSCSVFDQRAGGRGGGGGRRPVSYPVVDGEASNSLLQPHCSHRVPRPQPVKFETLYSSTRPAVSTGWRRGDYRWQSATVGEEGGSTLSIRTIDCTSSVCLSVCLSVYLFVCMSVCLSVCLSVCMSVCLSVCLRTFFFLTIYCKWQTISYLNVCKFVWIYIRAYI